MSRAPLRNSGEADLDRDLERALSEERERDLDRGRGGIGRRGVIYPAREGARAAAVTVAGAAVVTIAGQLQEELQEGWANFGTVLDQSKLPLHFFQVQKQVQAGILCRSQHLKCV